MDIEMVKGWFTLENIMNLIEQYRSLGPLPGVLLPFIEAFLPFLPLFLFVMANANAFGLWLGFLYSWAGACSGALLLFLLIRKYGQRWVLSSLPKHPKVRKSMDWVDRSWLWPALFSALFPVYTIFYGKRCCRFIQNKCCTVYAGSEYWENGDDFYNEFYRL